MSRIGLHILQGPHGDYGAFLHKCSNAGSPISVVKVVDDFGSALEAKKINPATVTVGRLTFATDPATGQRVNLQGLDDRWASDPNCTSTPAWYASVVLPIWKAHPEIDYFECFNEWAAHWDWQSKFYIAMMEIAEANGLRLALFSCAEGNPNDGDWHIMSDATKRALQASPPHVLALHEYSFDTMIDSPARVSHYLLHAIHLRRHNALCPIILTETGPNFGANFPGVDSFMTDVVWFDSELQHAADFGIDVKACMFSLGGQGDYAGANISQALPRLGDYIASHPTPIVAYYDRTIYLLHPDQYAKDWFEPAIRSDRKWTISQSAHDSAISAAGLTHRRIIAINPQLWGGEGKLLDFFNAHFPTGFEYVDVRASTSADIADAVNKELGETPAPTPDFSMDSPILDIPFRVTDYFDAPRDYANGKHEGLDLDAYDDTLAQAVPVYAAQNGTVEVAETTYPSGLNYGKHVVVVHPWYGQTYKTWYCHLSQVDVSVGDTVQKGQRVGIAGATGTTAIHLHLNLQHIGAGLSGYFIPDVVDPLPFINVPETPPTEWSGFFGVGSARSGDMTVTELQALGTSKVTAFKGANNMARDWSSQVQTQGVPAGGLMCRLYFDYSGLTTIRTPEDFLIDMRTAINEQRTRGCNLFEVGNELNLELIKFGDATVIATWLRGVYDLLKAGWPDINLVSPGLGPSTGGTGDTLTWMNAFQEKGIFHLSKYIGTHCYWPNRSQMMNADNGRFFERLATYLESGQKMSITEFSNNQNQDTDADKGAQYIEWSKALPSYVASAYAFALSASDVLYDNRRETWVRGTYTSDIVRVVGAR